MIKKVLKNGAVHDKNDIHDAMSLIETLRNENLPALFEIVKKCRFENHHIPTELTEVLDKYDIFKKNHAEMVLKDVVLSAITGRTLKDLEIGNPLEIRQPQLLTPIF